VSLALRIRWILRQQKCACTSKRIAESGRSSLVPIHSKRPGNKDRGASEAKTSNRTETRGSESISEGLIETAHLGVPTYIDFQYAIAYNKIIIIDLETVITGSFNLTKAAEDKNPKMPKRLTRTVCHRK
jgi:phosphatidylserine/phosphatidylglycerophosphate/cardiolipin synthase-like enzyme